MLLTIQNLNPKVIKNSRFKLSLLIYILVNTVKNYFTIYLRLIYIDVSQVVILLITYLTKYVFQTKQKI